jgi:hypothetical protein
MTQPWARKKTTGAYAATPLYLRYTFAVESVPRRPLCLAMEAPGVFRATLNGHSVETSVSATGWWTDRCIERVPVDPACLAVGENVLELTCAFREEVDLESVFLLGNFGVRVQGCDIAIVEPPRTLRIGDWTAQGLPFFSGAVTYRAQVPAAPAAGERAVLCVPKFEGACVRVLVNGREAGVMGWPPYELDITDFLGAGPCDLAIEVFGSRQNSFGPLHHVATRLSWVGPGEFVSENENWREDYGVLPCGLMQAPAIEYRR